MVGAGEEFDRAEWISGHQLLAWGSEMCLSGSAQGASGCNCVLHVCLVQCVQDCVCVNHLLNPN